MKTTTSVVLTGVVVAGGQWVQDKRISIRIVVGMAVFTIVLAAMGEANPQLAEQFGLLVLVTAVLLYGPSVVRGLGLTK